MKKLLFFLGVAIFLTVGCGPGSMASKAAPPTSPVFVCDTTKTYDSLLKYVSKIPGITIYKLNAEGLKLWLDYTNKLRAESKLFAYEGDTYIFGRFIVGGKYQVGEALFAKGCLLPGTSQSMTEVDFSAFMKNAHVNITMATQIFPKQ
jgi:hypothetical protein